MWQHILATPLGNRYSPVMTHYGIEIYNNNIIMPSIYTNPEVRCTNYLPVGNSCDPSCGNYFSRVEQENFSLNSSIAFSQPMTMQQVMPMNDLYGRSNLDGSTPYFSIGPPMPGPWGPPPMMYPSCPPWTGWYGPSTLPLLHFHLGWSGLAEGFGHRGYYTGDGRYGSVGHQQDRKAQRQENWIIQNIKSDHPVSPNATAASGQQHKQCVFEVVSSVDGPGDNQDQTGTESETSADDEAKHNTEKGPEEIAKKQKKA
jgi:hypothetical protein